CRPLLVLCLPRPPPPPPFPYTTLFRSAMLNLGGQVLGFPDAGVSSASKGETVADTIRIVSCYADIAAMRHPKEGAPLRAARYSRSEEHTSELQSRFDLVCRLLLEKKKKCVEQLMQSS